MSTAINFFFLVLLFLLVDSSTARYMPEGLFGPPSPDGQLTLRRLDESEIGYFGSFILEMKELQLEADEKYPLWRSTSNLDRSLFLLEKAQAFVQLWDNWRKNYDTGNPYGDLRNNIQGDLWPMHYNYCRRSEGTSLLTYMMYDFCRQLESTNLLKYMAYGLSPEADLV